MLQWETKDIKTLIENDDQLQWWAAILFAEMYGLCKGYDYIEEGRLSKERPLIVGKLREFEALVVQEKLNEVSKPKKIIERLATLEEKVKKLEKNQ